MRTPKPISRKPGTIKIRKHRVRKVTSKLRLEYAGYVLVRLLIRSIPFRVASDLSARLWQLIAPRLHRHERALKHLRLAYPDMPASECEAVILRMWGNLGRTMAESFVIDRIASSSSMIEVSIPDDVQRFIDEKRPLILTSLHLGNWELSAVAATMRGIELAGLYQRILNPLVDQAVTQSRAPFYKAGLLSKGHDTVKTFMRLIRDGTSVGIVSDVRDKRGIPVEFFGREAPTSPFPAMLSVLYNAPIIAAQCVRVAPDQFHVSVEHVSAPDGNSRDETIRNRTVALHAVFERWIRANPDQWMWAHRRWD